MDNMADREKNELTNVEHSVPTFEYTDDEVKKVIRKIDWHVMPLCLILYTFSVLDRSNLGNAKLAGMQEDIDLTGNRYEWLGTM